jgi:hypothetical protein
MADGGDSVNRKNHTIIFRADDSVYDFLGEISRKLRIDKSESVRKIVNWYIMAILLGEINVKGLEKRFAEKFARKREE